jgi:hypothetical protein
VNRYTFVFHVYPGEAATLENLSTHERIHVSDLAAVGPQIERWLASLTRVGESVNPAPADDRRCRAPPAQASPEASRDRRAAGPLPWN